ncbi:hypothetical protein [Pseudomonas phage D6]|nr:hypothetical protein [Pseudomonas phage D6]
MGKTYSVDALLDLTRNTPVVDFDLKRVTWMIDDDYDVKRMRAADISVPIIVTQLPTGEWVTLDGYHRVIKAAWQEKRKTIPAKIVTPQMLKTL